MTKYYIEHYGYIDDDQHSLAHYGVKGMKWRHHKYSSDYNYGDSYRADYYSYQGRKRQALSKPRYDRWRSDNEYEIKRANANHRNRMRRSANSTTRGDASRAEYYSNQGIERRRQKVVDDIKRSSNWNKLRRVNEHIHGGSVEERRDNKYTDPHTGLPTSRPRPRRRRRG